MHKFYIFAALLIAFLAACTTGGQTEPDVDSAGETNDNGGPTLELVRPSAGDEYPAADSGDAYPPAPDLANMPTGYPELTVVAPSGEVDLAELTPAPPALGTPQVMPAPGRPGAVPPQLAVIIEAIRLHLSRQSNHAVEAINFVSAETVTWPNGALGCPAEGLSYIEVLVEGSRITLEAGGETYTYHTDGGRNFVLCRDGRPVSTGGMPQR